MRSLRTSTLLLLALAGCDDPFIPASVITGPRVLAVRAEPPEARTGDRVKLELLFVDPERRTPELAWFACDPLPATVLSPCDDETVLRAPGNFEAQHSLRLLSTSSVAIYAYDGVIPGDAPENAIVLARVRAGGETILARKVIRYAAEGPRNTNPTLDSVLLDMTPTSTGTVPLIRLGSSHDWAGIVAESSFELYSRRRPDGTTADAIDDIRLEWFTTHGRFGVDYKPPSAQPILQLFVDSGVPPPRDASMREGGGEPSKDERGWKVVHTIPKEGGDPPLPAGGLMRVAVVIRDTRGGANWVVRDLRVLP